MLYAYDIVFSKLSFYLMILKDESTPETPEELVESSLRGITPVQWIKIPRKVAKDFVLRPDSASFLATVWPWSIDSLWVIPFPLPPDNLEFLYSKSYRILKSGQKK